MVAVSASMVILFVAPSGLFVAGTFGATGVMVIAALLTDGASWPKRTFRALATGLLSAAVLYFIFYGGNLAIVRFGFPGVSGPTGASIYSLIAAPSNPLVLQIGVLVFDAVGYESYFRGTLQRKLQPMLGPSSAALVALVDAALHLVTGNLLWVATTFVADFVWGLTCYYGKDLSASLTSHLLWDIAIFIIRPIR